MSKKRLSFAAIIVAMGVILGTYGIGRAQTPIATARCQIVVPQEWGDFVTAGQYGLVFKDKNGTLRFISKIPCGLEGTPNVSLEVRRK